jgi:hypothetical protein
MRLTRPLFVALLVAAVFAACDLNPQPLPPGDEKDNGAAGEDAGGSSFSPPQDKGDDAGHNGGTGGGDAGSDSAPAPPGPEGGTVDAGDDGGDGGDADATTE